jgi:hypothetical protein
MTGSKSVLDLPPEIRFKILEALLVPTFWYSSVFVTPNERGRVHLKQQCSLFTDGQIYPEILRTSRQMSYEELPILYGRNKFQVCGDIQDRKDEGYSFRENERYFITLRKLLAQIGTKNVARIKHILMIGDSSIPCGSIENFVSQTMTVGAQYRSLELLLSDYPNLGNLQTLVFHCRNIREQDTALHEFIDHLGFGDEYDDAYPAVD